MPKFIVNLSRYEITPIDFSWSAPSEHKMYDDVNASIQTALRECLAKLPPEYEHGFNFGVFSVLDQDGYPVRYGYRYNKP